MHSVRRWRVTRIDGTGERREHSDQVIGEEPLEIRLDGEPFTVTMRTPGHDFEMVFGLLHAEGIITTPDDVATLGYRGGVNPDGTRSFNIVDARLRVPLERPAAARNVYVSASCGMCGTTALEGVEKPSRFAPALDRFRIEAAELAALPDRLRVEQRLFERTGGAHASALFRLPGSGEAGEKWTPVCVREDVGRHNAVDKLVGWALQQGEVPLSATVLQLSGRISYELVQKAHLAGIAMISAVGAPSALALELADTAGITVAGFVRGGRVNLYTHPDRVI